MSTSPPPAILEVEGTISGLLDLAGPTTWGLVRLRAEGDTVRFALSIDLTDKSPVQIAQIDAARVASAVEAAVAANCDVAVSAHVEGIHRPTTPGIGQVTKSLPTSWNVRVLARADPESQHRAAVTAALVLEGGRREQLHSVYLLASIHRRPGWGDLISPRSVVVA